MNIVNILIEKALSNPDSLAIRYPRRTFFCNKLIYNDISFKTFLELIESCSIYFTEKCVCCGEKVVVMVPPGEHLLVVTYALLKIGAIPVVIDPGMGIKSLKECLESVRPNGIVCTRTTSVFCSIIGLNRYKKIIISASKYKHCDNIEISPAVDNNGIAAVLFTSGSTGKPKGVNYYHEQFLAQINCLKTSFNIENGEVDMPLLPVFSLFNPIFGMTTVVPEINPAKPSKLNTKKVIEAIELCSVTNTFGSPRLWWKLVKYCEKNNIVLPSLKRVFMAGAPVHPSLLKRVQSILPNGIACTPYGATEALPISSITANEVVEETYKKSLEGAGTCVGKPLSNVDVKIIDIVDEEVNSLNKFLQPYQIGEIIVSAQFVTKEYFNDTISTKLAKIMHNGKLWHRMGDLGYFDETGKLWFCGRKVERVSSKGKTFFTDCCEHIFNSHQNVLRSALISLVKNNEKIPAIVVEPIIFPKNKALFINELRQIAMSSNITKDINHFFLYKNFPVDVRHNAKIHRLKLSKIFQTKI